MFKSKILSLTSFKVFTIFAFIGLVIYSNSLSGAFMRDDYSQIVNNPTVQDIKNIPKFFSSSTFFGGDPGTLIGRYYKPITSTYFTLVASIFGLHSFMFHFFQILLHIINSFLIYKLFEKFFKKPLAIFLGLLFLVHPINTESVVYISCAQEVLFLFFGLTSLLLSTKKTFTNVNFGVIFVTLLLSLLSKETGILFIPSILIYTYLYNRKYFFKFLTLSSCLIIFYLILRFNAIGLYGLYGSSIPSAPIIKAGFLQRLINIPLIVYTYLTTFLFPKDLVINQSWIIKTLNVKDFFIPLLFDLLIFGLIIIEGIIIRRRFNSKFKDYIFFLSIFLLGLGMHIQVIPLDMTVAERWFYFPIVGLIGLIGLIINNFKMSNPLRGKNSNLRLLLFTVALTTIALLSIRVIYRNYDWKNELTLVSHDIKISRESYHLEQNLANNYFLNNEIEKAIYHYERSIQIFPYFTNYTNLGTAYRKAKEIDKAEQSYKKALEIGNFYLTYEQLASLYYSEKQDYTMAKEVAQRGLTYYPNNQKLLLILALSYYKLDQLENAKQGALECYKRTKNQDCYKLYYGISNNVPIKGI